MNWISLLFNSGSIIDKILSFIPNPAERQEFEQKLKYELETASIKAMEDQRAINLEEAKSGSWFTSGWRPGAGWVTVLCIACYYIPRFLLTAAFWSYMCWKQGMLVPYPALDITEVMGLLSTLLGVGTLRTIDKMNGTDTKAIK